MITEELIRVLRHMATQLGQGTALVPALEAGIAKAGDLALKAALGEMKAYWLKDQTILPPVDAHRELFPRAIYWLTAAGFHAGLLDSFWSRGAQLLHERLRARGLDSAREHQELLRLARCEIKILVNSGVRESAAVEAVAEDLGIAAEDIG